MRYWVFNEEQLETALAAWLHASPQLESLDAEGKTIVCGAIKVFLESPEGKVLRGNKS